MKLAFQGEYPAKLKYDLERLGFTLTLHTRDHNDSMVVFECEPPSTPMDEEVDSVILNSAFKHHYVKDDDGVYKY